MVDRSEHKVYLQKPNGRIIIVTSQTKVIPHVPKWVQKKLERIGLIPELKRTY